MATIINKINKKIRQSRWRWWLKWCSVHLYPRHVWFFFFLFDQCRVTYRLDVQRPRVCAVPDSRGTKSSTSIGKYPLKRSWHSSRWTTNLWAWQRTTTTTTNQRQTHKQKEIKYTKKYNTHTHLCVFLLKNKSMEGFLPHTSPSLFAVENSQDQSHTQKQINSSTINCF